MAPDCKEHVLIALTREELEILYCAMAVLLAEPLITLDAAATLDRIEDELWWAWADANGHREET